MTGLVASVNNVLRVYRAATPEQVAKGAQWYHEAHSLALALDPINPRRAAGVIAALSPQKRWKQNVALAVRAFADGEASGHTKQSCTAATRILAGEDFDLVLKGPKIRAFAATITDPAFTDSVVVDRHAHDIAVGQVTDDLTRGRALRGKRYDVFSALFVAAAERAGVAPSVMQATTWVQWRETRAAYAAYNLREEAA